MKKIFTFMVFSILFYSGFLAAEKDTFKTARKLYIQEKYTEAIALLNNANEDLAGSEKLLALKTDILIKLKHYKEALISAKARVKAAERKSPWRYITVVDIAVKLNDRNQAFLWFEKAIEKGLLNYTALDRETHEFLKEHSRYKDAIKRIQDNIGIGRPVKDFSFTLFNGKEFDIKLAKGKVVLLDFWATWCPPCIKGIPHLKEFYQEYKDQGFEIIGISLDSDKQAVAGYIKKENLSWPIRFSGDAWFDKTARLFNVNLIPSYWLIDRKGKLRDFGYHLREKEELHQAIARLVKEK